MKHRDPDAMAINACDAIPTAPADAISANQIFWAQKKPRLPMRDIEAMADAAAARGDIEVIQDGNHRKYRWAPLSSNTN